MLQELADRAAIVDAVISYATALDTRDWERLGSLFTDDACWEYSGSENGSPGLTRSWPGSAPAWSDSTPPIT